jgi:hypothetical protein
MEFSNVMPLMAKQSGGSININQYCYHISIHNLCNVMTVNDKPSQWNMQYFMWWDNKHDSLCIWWCLCSSQVKYISLRLYSATCGISALVRIINVLTVELLCNLCAGFFCNYYCCMEPSATVFYINDSKNFSTAWYITVSSHVTKTGW